MMRLFFFLALTLLAVGLTAQTPQARLSYDDKSGTTGHTLVLGGKSFGPYKEIATATYSTSGSAALFLATKRDKTYIVGQGKEAGPLGAGFDPDETSISDDGQVSAVLATNQPEEEDGVSRTQLWVNGQLFGPYLEVYPFEYAETGGTWIAAVQVGTDEYSVLLNGKSQGTASSVDKVWMSPDGKSWGYAVRDSEGALTVVTQDKTYDAVQSGNFDQLNLRDAHWAYGIRIDDEQELIVVDGKAFAGYLNFSGLYTTASGRHWGFEAEKLTETGDYPVVVIDGKEFVGEGLEATSLGTQESFVWTIKEGTKVNVQVLALL